MTTVRPKASLSSGRCPVQHIGPYAAMAAAPSAWRAREAISISKDTERPQKSEPIVNSANPHARTFLTPMSAYILPMGIISAASTRK